MVGIVFLFLSRRKNNGQSNESFFPSNNNSTGGESINQPKQPTTGVGAAMALLPVLGWDTFQNALHWHSEMQQLNHIIQSVEAQPIQEEESRDSSGPWQS